MSCATIAVLIQHNPNEGLKHECNSTGLAYNAVLIQHNPNEGLKLLTQRPTAFQEISAHSAQPERGIET